MPQTERKPVQMAKPQPDWMAAEIDAYQRDAPWDVSVSLSDRTVTVSIGGRMFRFVMNHEQLGLFVSDLTKAEQALGGLREQDEAREEQDRAAD